MSSAGVAAVQRLLGACVCRYRASHFNPDTSTPQHLTAAAATHLPPHIGCNVYISEGRNIQLVRRLEVRKQHHQHPAAACPFYSPQLSCQLNTSAFVSLCCCPFTQALCRQHPRAVVLAHTFIDDAYNRTGLTLTANSIPEVCAFKCCSA